jgi:hypothetical protein
MARSAGKELTKDEKGDPCDNDSQVPQRPEVCLVERHASILKFTELIICKCSDPDIEKDLSHRDAVRMSLDQDGIVKGK